MKINLHSRVATTQYSSVVARSEGRGAVREGKTGRSSDQIERMSRALVLLLVTIKACTICVSYYVSTLKEPDHTKATHC